MQPLNDPESFWCQEIFLAYYKSYFAGNVQPCGAFTSLQDTHRRRPDPSSGAWHVLNTSMISQHNTKGIASKILKLDNASIAQPSL